MNPLVIDTQGLSVFRSGSQVIKEATFSISKGEYVGLVGPNGGGKTTLILGLLGKLPSTGEIRLFGERLADFRSWDKIAYVSQSAINFDSHFPLSVKELVSLGLVGKKNLGRRFSREDWKKVDEVIDFMGIGDIRDKRIGHLSGGQKQRVFVAKALVRSPELLILDEPVAGVDAATQERFYQKLSDLNQTMGATIIMVSHDLSAVFCRMSSVICVNREVHSSKISEGMDHQEVLKKVYGEHFHFVFHEHECRGSFA
ncbi:MAG: metal ABC transporter ATP-binding protein [Candidatus Thermoplasmatota archaeon]|nr:metal ABC transporter ATP-binding protein [Candidatus Thermoplasmatota archaeon]